MNNGWIGFDFDGTLVTHEPGQDMDVFGTVIQPVLDRLIQHLKDGYECRIFTARAFGLGGYDVERHKQAQKWVGMIQEWCKQYVGIVLPVTCTKDFGMIRLYDDRCVQVEPNTGAILGKE